MTEIDRARVFGERPEALERIAPGHCGAELEAEHLARYHWAGQWVAGRRVLDVACGTGYGAQLLREAGALYVTSVDLSREAVWFGRGRYDLRAVVAEACVLPFQSATFDAVVSLETIEHLPVAEPFLNELARVTKPGAPLLLSTPNVLLSLGVNPYHLREYTLDELVQLLTAAGFRVCSTRGQHWRIRSRIPWRVKGLRRAAWMLQRRAAVGRMPRWLCDPVYWCVQSERVGP